MRTFLPMRHFHSERRRRIQDSGFGIQESEVRSQESEDGRLTVIGSLLAVILIPQSREKDLRSCFLASPASDELQRCFAPLSMTGCILTPES
jgi:hypothetical protein